MFFPLYDDNPTSIRPYVTQFIVVACTIVFVFQFLAGMPGQLFLDFGFIPDRFFSNSFFDLTIISSMFLHGGIAHIVGNMVYLWIFGDNVEESMGRIRFVLFYITCGLIAALSQALVNPDSNIPMVGASGAIAGVLGAYLMLHPRANVSCFVFLIIFIQVIRIPAFIVLGFWILGQFFSLPSSLQDEGGVAYLAHIGGFIAGMVLVPFFKKKDVKLFDIPHSRPWQNANMNFRNENPRDFLKDFINKSEDKYRK